MQGIEPAQGAWLQVLKWASGAIALLTGQKRLRVRFADGPEPTINVAGTEPHKVTFGLLAEPAVEHILGVCRLRTD